MTIKSKLNMPKDNYDVAAWEAFYAENPGIMRSLSAAAVESEGSEGGGAGEDTAEPKLEDPAPKAGEGDEAPKDGGEKKSGMSDTEASLLKDVMRHKTEKRELAEKLKAFEGVDPQKYQELLNAQQQAEQERLRKEGDFDKLREQIVSQSEEKINAISNEKAALEEQNRALQAQIDELTIGGAFANSDTVKETVYTPKKARSLFGSHFERDAEGNVVAYDKPAGDPDRTVLVDEKGNPLGFDAALKKIVDMDEDSEKNWRPTLKPGGNSKESLETPSKPEKQITSQDKIEAGVDDLLKGMKTTM